MDHVSAAAEGAGFFDLAFDICFDAVKDTLWVALFLLLTYLAMEWLEHKTSDAAARAVQRAGVAGPAIGGMLGIVPQCGFSAAAATLYAGRVVTLGTLFAVFLSTSDEMLPIFLASQLPTEAIASVLLTKMAIGIVLGFIVDAVVRAARKKPEGLRIGELCEAAGCHCEERCAGCEITCEKCKMHEGPDCHGADCAGAECSDESCECGHHHDAGRDDSRGHHHMHEHHEHGAGSIVKSAVKHTLQVTAFVFVVTLALNVALALVGEDALARFMESNETLSVFASALIGLVPNCAASVAIAQLFADGVLGSGAMLAGLLASAGIGLLVLCRTNRHPRENIAIIACLFAVGCVCGLAVNALGVSFA